MSLAPDPRQLTARALGDLRHGVAVVLRGSDGGGAVVAAAETLRAPVLDALRDAGAVLALSDWRARTLRIAGYDGDLVRLRLTDGMDAATIAALADPTADLAAPLKGPWRAEREGGANFHRAALRLCKTARLLPAALVAEVADAEGYARTLGLTLLDPPGTGAPALTRIVSARVPLAAHSDSRLHVFRSDDYAEEHHAVEMGRPPRDAPVLVRLHSACFTGDLLASLKCDCGLQLHAAMAAMGAEGAGVLLYLDQEGRGIGLANKMRAYSLQDQGFDTVEANHRLGFEDDERDFRVGAAMLRALGIGSVRLMTNNPAKIARMEDEGITVTERVPLKVAETPQNAGYLETKRRKSGHLR